MCRLHRHRVWDYWLAGVLGSFAALQYPALKYGCHDPLSRVLWRRHMGLVLFTGGVVLGVHVMRYELPKEKS